MSDSTRKPLIWVVDDDPELRTLLLEYLGAQGFEVRGFPDGRDIERRLLRERPDLIVLDYMLPGDDGLTLCRRIRASDEVGIIMLTARNELSDRIAGIDGGADDYIGKPFAPQELVVRIRSVLRRRLAIPPGAPKADEECVTFGDYRLDFGSRILWRRHEAVTLTTTEFALLSALCRNPHRPLTRERLLELARGPGTETGDRSVDVQISKLRKMIHGAVNQPEFIQTVWGYGYVFVPDVPGESA
ncbi:MAG: response regulator [Betaproteobacteria bacterium]|nr:response regulator [Betaproteobacteria bacterium]